MDFFKDNLRKNKDFYKATNRESENRESRCRPTLIWLLYVHENWNFQICIFDIFLGDRVMTKSGWLPGNKIIVETRVK